MATIMVVDDEQIMTKTLSMLLNLKTKENVVAFNCPEEALGYMERSENPVDLIVSDFIMPAMNGIEFLLKAKDKRPETESILLTGYADKENAIKSINEVGVYYYLEKPWNNEELVKIVNNALEKKNLSDNLADKMLALENSNAEINRLYEMVKSDLNQEIEGAKSMMLSLANVIEARDRYTDGHTRRVSAISVAIGKKMDLPMEDLNTLEIAGVIHDIGKVSVDDAVLNKPGKLTEEEFEAMKQHPVVGEKICRSLNMLGDALEPILYHHEKLDGSGYPVGLKGDEINTVTRIITAADMFDAMYSDRPYRTKMPYDKVKGILQEEVTRGRIDSYITDMLFDVVESEEGQRLLV